MKSAIIYCSKTGNTERVARAINRGLENSADMLRLDLTPDGLLKNYDPLFTFDLSAYELIVFGGWVMVMRVHPCLAAYIGRCEHLEGKRVAGFMTGGAIFSRSHAYADFKELISGRGAALDDFLFTTTLLGPLLTEKKLRTAEAFGRKICAAARMYEALAVRRET